MELMSLQGQLFVVEGPDYDIQTKSWRTSVDFFGNMWCNPRYQFKSWPAANPGDPPLPPPRRGEVDPEPSPHPEPQETA
jgi:hypothetical protein